MCKSRQLKFLEQNRIKTNLKGMIKNQANGIIALEHVLYLGQPKAHTNGWGRSWKLECYNKLPTVI